MVKRFLCFCLLFSFLSLAAFSEGRQKRSKKETIPIQHEIVVTASRIETPLKEIASSVTVITREELEKTNKLTILEALQEVLGLHIIQNGKS